MHYWTTENPADLTFQAPFTGRCTPGWITRHTIVFPRVGSAAPDADRITVADLTHLVSLFLATADRLADLASQIARMERQARAGKISPRHAARRLRPSSPPWKPPWKPSTRFRSDSMTPAPMTPDDRLAELLADRVIEMVQASLPHAGPVMRRQRSTPFPRLPLSS